MTPWTICDPAEVYSSLDDLLAGRPAWHADAACLEHPELSWFPERGEPAGPAKAICATCLVRVECLSTALADVNLTGIWGGTSDRQRQVMRRTAA